MLVVSIHAPARGATRGTSGVVIFLGFQSTRPRGARLFQVEYSFRHLAGFNPRAREGRDENNIVANIAVAVSIHAPARGATSLSRLRFSIITLFQSTRPRGARPAI